MHTNNPRTSSTPASSSGLRPRNARLISGLSGYGDSEPASTQRSASPLPSPYASRGASPIPSARLSRTTRNGGTGNSSPGGALAGLWGNSWTTLQGLASDLLGDSSDTGPTRTRRPLSRLRAERGGSSSAPPPREWGPGGDAGLGMGARDGGEREREVRARKRKDMLLRREESFVDARGGVKRRTSDEDRPGSARGDEERDALVYLHSVRKDDTLAGITIRYNCSANGLRRANRMWPNDTVQSRRVLVLPVDACGVKGKPISDAEAADLLGGDAQPLAAGQAQEVGMAHASLPGLNGISTANSDAVHRNRTNSASTSTSTLTSVATSTSPEPPYIHDSWVLLTSSPTHPTQIARLNRQNLAFFPPARRKSANIDSPHSTPSTSLDLSRAPGSPQLSRPPQRPPRTRKLSNASTGYFPSYLAGPGGVGSMHKPISSPGPGQDGLNKLFARHLPDVAPPRNQQSLYQPEMPLYTDAGTPIADSGSATPSHAVDRNLILDFQNLGGAVEGWMRRVASRAQAAREPQEQQRAARASVGTPGKGAGGVGDLIEMTDEFEIGGEESDDDDTRGRVGGESSGYLARSGVRQRESRGDYFGKAGKAD